MALRDFSFLQCQHLPPPPLAGRGGGTHPIQLNLSNTDTEGRTEQSVRVKEVITMT